MKNKILYSSNIYNYPDEYLDNLREELAEELSIDKSAVTDDDLIERNNCDFDYINELVDNNPYKTAFVALGEFGRWNGSHVIGRVAKTLSEVTCIITPTSMYDLVIELTDRELVYKNIYHDGTSYVKVRILTKQGLKWYENNKDKYTGLELAKHLMAIKGYTKKWVRR